MTWRPTLTRVQRCQPVLFREIDHLGILHVYSLFDRYILSIWAFTNHRIQCVALFALSPTRFCVLQCLNQLRRFSWHFDFASELSQASAT